MNDEVESTLREIEKRHSTDYGWIPPSCEVCGDDHPCDAVRLVAAVRAAQAHVPQMYYGEVLAALRGEKGE